MSSRRPDAHPTPSCFTSNISAHTDKNISKGPKSKRRRKPKLSWTPLEQKIIKFVRQHPIVYFSQGNPGNDRKANADKLWEELADELNKSVIDIKERWRQIRSINCKINRGYYKTLLQNVSLSDKDNNESEGVSDCQKTNENITRGNGDMNFLEEKESESGSEKQNINEDVSGEEKKTDKNMSKNPKTKRRRGSSWTPLEQKIITFVRKHPTVAKGIIPGYCKAKANKLWKELADELNRSVIDIKERWRKIRQIHWYINKGRVLPKALVNGKDLTDFLPKPTKCRKTKRGRKMSWTPLEQKIIKFVRQHPIIYTKDRHPQRQAKVDILWEELAEDLNRSVIDIKERWRQIKYITWQIKRGNCKPKALVDGKDLTEFLIEPPDKENFKTGSFYSINNRLPYDDLKLQYSSLSDKDNNVIVLDNESESLSDCQKTNENITRSNGDMDLLEEKESERGSEKHNINEDVSKEEKKIDKYMSKGRKNKRRRNRSLSWSPLEQKIIKFVRQHPTLYSKGHFRKAKANKLWEKLADKLNLSVIDIKERWRQIRTIHCQINRGIRKPNALVNGKDLTDFLLEPPDEENFQSQSSESFFSINNRLPNDGLKSQDSSLSDKDNNVIIIGKESERLSNSQKTNENITKCNDDMDILEEKESERSSEKQNINEDLNGEEKKTDKNMSKGPKTKRRQKRKFSSWSPLEQKIIKFARQHSIFSYSKGRPSVYRKAKTDKLWEELAEELSRSVMDIKDRWRNIREIHRQIEKGILKPKALVNGQNLTDFLSEPPDEENSQTQSSEEFFSIYDRMPNDLKSQDNSLSDKANNIIIIGEESESVSNSQKTNENITSSNDDVDFLEEKESKSGSEKQNINVDVSKEEKKTEINMSKDPKTKRGRKKSWTPFDQKIIKFVRQHPIIYTKDRHPHRQAKVHILWEKLAEELNRSVIDIKVRWHRIRTIHWRINKGRSLPKALVNGKDLTDFLPKPTKYRKTKRERKMSSWTPLEQKIIKFVRQHPIIYTKGRHPQRQAKADILWEELAEELNRSVIDVKERWRKIWSTHWKIKRGICMPKALVNGKDLTDFLLEPPDEENFQSQSSGSFFSINNRLPNDGHKSQDSLLSDKDNNVIIIGKESERLSNSQKTNENITKSNDDMDILEEKESERSSEKQNINEDLSGEEKKTDKNMSKGPKTKRRQKRKLSWSPLEQKIIKFARQHPIFSYSKGRPSHYHKAKTDKLWEELAEELSRSVIDIKKRWRNIREIHSQIKKGILLVNGENLTDFLSEPPDEENSQNQSSESFFSINDRLPSDGLKSQDNSLSDKDNNVIIIDEESESVSKSQSQKTNENITSSDDDMDFLEEKESESGSEKQNINEDKSKEEKKTDINMSKGPKTKPERKMWTPFEQKIIKFVRQHPIIYTKGRHPQRQAKADILWEELAEELNRRVIDVKERWRNIWFTHWNIKRGICKPKALVNGKDLTDFLLEPPDEENFQSQSSGSFFSINNRLPDGLKSQDSLLSDKDNNVIIIGKESERLSNSQKTNENITKSNDDLDILEEIELEKGSEKQNINEVLSGDEKKTDKNMSKGPKFKDGRKRVWSWSPLDQKIIKFARQHPTLYSKGRLPGCYRKTKVDKLWEELAQELSRSVIDVKERWQSIREIHRKIEKGSLKPKALVNGKDLTEFLLDQPDEENSQTQSSESFFSINDILPNDGLKSHDSPLSDEDNDVIIVEEESENVSNSQKINKNITRSNDDMDLLEEKESESVSEKQNVIEDTSEEENSDEDITEFFQTLGRYVEKTYSNKKQMEIRLRIWSIVTNAELEMLNDEN